MSNDAREIPSLTSEQLKKLHELAKSARVKYQALNECKDEFNTGDKPKYEESAINKDSVFKYSQSQRGSRKPLDVYKTAWWYLGALFLVGASEWLINYDSFLAKFGVPAFAAGLTVIVALIIAYGSHLIGVLWKQPEKRDELRKGSDAHANSGAGTIWLYAVTVVGLIAALIMVGWNRYTYLAETQGLLIDQSVWPSVIYTLLANVIVFVVGCLFSFAAHSHGVYGSDLKDLNIRKKNYNKIKSKLERETKKLMSARKADAELNLQDEEEGQVLNQVAEVLGEVFIAVLCDGNDRHRHHEKLEKYKRYKKQLEKH